MRSDVEVQRLRPRADLVRVEVEGHEDDALAGPQRLANLRDDVLELPHAGRAAEEDRVVRREAFLQVRTPRIGLPLARSRVLADTPNRSMFRFVIYRTCPSSQP